MHVISVNVGRPRPNPWKGLEATGIDKRPVTGPVAVTAPGPKGTGAVGLAGDRVYDVKHHGGTHQAVYAFAREDLDRWEGVFGRPLPSGSFGENLTTAGYDVNGALIGERWRVGGPAGPLLEVSCPRIPCVTFAGWLGSADTSGQTGLSQQTPGEQGWMKRFTQDARPGPYLRVVEPGELAAGDALEVVHRPGHHAVTVSVAFRALTTEPGLLPRLLDADALPPEDLAAVRKRLG